MISELQSPFLVTHKFDATAAEMLAAAIKALADPTRLMILHLLAEHEVLSGGALVRMVGLTQPTISHHLRILSEAGLIDSRKVGKVGQETARSINVDAIRALVNLIDPLGDRR